MSVTDFFSDTLTFAEVADWTRSGKNYDTKFSVEGRLQWKPDTVRLADGTEEKTEIVFYTDQEIKVGARMWLPGEDTGDNDKSRAVLAVYRTHDKIGGQILYKVLA